MGVLSKPLSEEEKDIVHKKLCRVVQIGVMTQNVQIMADTALITAAVNGDSARAGALLAATSSMGGLIEFVFNPILGKMTDDYGRKWVYYIGPLISGVGMSIVVLTTQGKSLPILLAHKALSWSLISMSLSFIGPVTISDMYSGQELAIKTVKMFGAIGLSLVFAPALGSMIMQSTGNPMDVFKLRLAAAVVQLVYAHKAIPETLLPERRRPFKLSHVNPFSFLQLFRKSRSLRVLAAVLFFNCCSEGKNVIALMQTWMNGVPLKWDLKKQSIYSSLFGIIAFGSGSFLAPKLIAKLGPRMFTSSTNILNAIGFTVKGLGVPDYDTAYWAGLLLHGPGVNNTSAAAIKGLTTEHAVANGIARGEYGGMYSSLRTFSMIVAPSLFGWAYKRGISKDTAGKSRVFLPWVVVAIIGAVLPELLHRSLTAEDMKVPTAKPSSAS